MRKIISAIFMILCFALPALAQVHSVTGKISDPNGNPVPFATITVKGTKSAVTADENGSFNIKAKPTDVLTISGVGLKSQDFKIAGSNFLTIKVEKVTADLSEVVVTTALGIKRQAKELGFAATTIGNKDLT
jgi:hypothetical protein